MIHACDPDCVPWMTDLKRNMKLSDQEKAFYYFIESIPLVINILLPSNVYCVLTN